VPLQDLVQHDPVGEPSKTEAEHKTSRDAHLFPFA
jgi:hypothetical protein